MDTLEPNMYVRIKDNRNVEYIGKLININEFREPSMMYCVDIQASDYVFISKEQIINAKFNIADLIEEHDYIRIITSNYFEPVYYSYGKLVIRDDIDISKYTNKFIAEIITKQQMKQMAYKIGD